MRISDLMTRDVLVIDADVGLKDAAIQMITSGVSGLAVTNSSGTLVGVITEADFVKKEAKRGEPRKARLLKWFAHDEKFPSTERLVRDVMSTDPITVGPDTDHVAAARLMQTKGIKRLPVIDSDSSLVGVLSRSDILTAFARPDEEILSELTHHVMPKVLWIDPKRVSVRCEDGNVTLTGLLETKGDVTLLADMTRRLDGVVSVEDNLTWEIDNTKTEMVPPPSVLGAPRANW